MIRSIESDYNDPHHIGHDDAEYTQGFEPTIFDIPTSHPSTDPVADVGSTSAATGSALPYDAIFTMAEAAIESVFRASPPVSARPMTKAEREVAQFKPHGLVDVQSIEARSMPVPTTCPWCGVELIKHTAGALTLVCPR